jgi:hypothetical protein
MNMLRKSLALFAGSRDFTMLMGAQFCAQAGDGIVQAALAKLIVFGNQKGFDVEGARSPDELLRIVLYVFVPYTVVSPFLGVLIDRWDRRKLLFFANGLRAVVVLLIALISTNSVPETALFLAFLLTLASTRLVLATKAAALPAALRERDLVEGNAVSQLGGAVFQLAGAGAALIAAGIVSAEPIVFIGALVYAAGAGFALGVRLTGDVREHRSLGQEIGNVIGSIAEGVREVARTATAAAAITTYFWLRWMWSFSIVAIGFVARDLLADEDITILIVTAGSGAVGAGLGFLFADRLHARVRSTAHLVLAASAVAGIAVAVLGAIELRLSIAVLTFFLGFGFFLAKVSLDTLVQESLGDDFRGRAFSLYDIAYNVAWVIAAVVLKIAWSPSSQGLLIALGGVAFLVGLGGLGMWFRSLGLLATPAATVGR